MTVKTILLLPHADARERLLAPHAPSCRRVGRGYLSWGTLVADPNRVRHCTAYGGSCPVDEHVHLPLARDGAEVYEGTDRLRRIIGAEKSIGFLISPEVPPELHEVYRLARYAEWVGLGAAVLVDADGKEVVDG